MGLMFTQRAFRRGVATPHPDYVEAASKWSRMRDCHEGEDAVKARRELYLPKPGGMEKDDYNAYLMRALYMPALNRTVQVLSGLLFREPPEVEAPQEVMDVASDITLTNKPLASFAAEMIVEMMVTGRAGLLLDFVDIDRQIRPYWRLYRAEDVLSWRVDYADRVPMLGRLVLVDDDLVPHAKEEHRLVTEHGVREFTLDEEGLVIKRWVLREGLWRLASETRPDILDDAVKMIPFIFANWDSLGVEVSRPPMLGIANTSLSHYRSTADLEQGAYYVSLPTVVITGMKAPRGGFKLGASQALVLDEKGATADYMEINGPGLQSIHTNLARKERHMAALGARLLDQTDVQAETAQAHRIRAQADASLLRTIAGTADMALTQALKQTAVWMGESDETVSVALNREFLEEAERPPAEALLDDNNRRRRPSTGDPGNIEPTEPGSGSGSGEGGE